MAEEVAAPEAAPIFPVGHDLHSERFLFANGPANGLIFDLFKVASADFLSLQFRSRILDFWRTQQTADVLGAKCKRVLTSVYGRYKDKRAFFACRVICATRSEQELFQRPDCAG